MNSIASAVVAALLFFPATSMPSTTLSCDAVSLLAGPLPFRDQRNCPNCWMHASLSFLELQLQARQGTTVRIELLPLYLEHLRSQADKELERVRINFNSRQISKPATNKHFNGGGSHQDVLSILERPSLSLPVIAETPANTDAMTALFGKVHQRLLRMNQDFAAVPERTADTESRRNAIVTEAREDVRRLFDEFTSRFPERASPVPPAVRTENLLRPTERWSLGNSPDMLQTVRTPARFQEKLLEEVAANRPVLLSFRIEASAAANADAKELTLDLTPAERAGLTPPVSDAQLVQLGESVAKVKRDGHESVVVGVESRNGRIERVKLLNSWGETGGGYIWLTRDYLLSHTMNIRFER